MAHLSNTRTPVADMGGKHLLDPGMRSGEPRATSSEKDSPKINNGAGGCGSGQSASDEIGNGDDDEDSNGDKEDNEDEDDPAAIAPSRGGGLGKGKRPVIRVEHAGGDESQEDVEETSSRGAGLDGNAAVDGSLMRNKKRTFSNVSNNSVLFGEDEKTFPRLKLPRTLSNNSGKGLLIYQKGEPTEEQADLSMPWDMFDYNPNPIDVDDEDYSGVNLISDESDIDVEHLEHQETQWLIDEHQASELFGDAARRPSLDSTASDDNLSGLPSVSRIFSPDLGQTWQERTEVVPFSREPSVLRKYSDSSTKRVRFDDEVNMSDSASTSSSELDTSLWPDLFEKDKLPQQIYHMIEHDQDMEHFHYMSSGSEHSYWDFGQDDGSQHGEDGLEDDSSGPGSSGYESDLGDTTDDCASDFGSPPPQTPQQKSILRRPSSAPGSKVSSPKPYQRSSRPNTTKKSNPPLRGVFIHGEENEAIAVTSRTTKTVAFYRPRTARVRRNYTAGSSATSTAHNSPPSMLQGEESDFNGAFTSPFQSSTDIMFSGIFGAAPNNDFVSLLGSVGPPEAFYPFVSVNQNGRVSLLSDDDTFGEEDTEIGQDLNIDEFMDFGPEGDETDVEPEDSTDAPATPATSMIVIPGSTPAQSSAVDMTPTNRKRTTSDALLEHFDRGVVTAFRNNQNHYHSLARLPYDPDLRASVSRPLRSGRTAEAVMSPMRKRSSISKKTNKVSYGTLGHAVAGGGSGATSRRRGPAMGSFLRDQN